MDSRKETRRLLKRLRVLIHVSARTQREIEQIAGFSRGYLSQILGGRAELKLRHLLMILEALDTCPADFFFQLFPRRRNRVLQALDGLRRDSRRFEQPLILDLARLYGYGIESLEDLERRLERCEDALERLAAAGPVKGQDAG